MAPRMKMAVSKRKEQEEHVERRTKARADRGRSSRTHRSPSPQRQPSPPPPSPAPRSTLLSSRIVQMGRRINFNFLEREGFELGDKLKEMGWEYICTLDLPTYPDLVKEFYENGDFSKGLVQSVVKNVHIQFSDALLGEIIRAPIEGDKCNQLSERAEGVNLILEKDDASGYEIIQANQLSAEMRLLHHIINRLLFLKTGRFDYVSERDILVMHHVILGLPLNLPHLMIEHMIDQGKRKGGSLPYGMVLTLIFIQFGVSLVGEIKKELLHTDIYGEGSLKRMGFIKTEGRWIHRGQEEERPSAPSSSRRRPEPEPRSEPAASSEFVRIHPDQIREILDIMHSENSARHQATFDRMFDMMRELRQSQQETVSSLEMEMRNLKIEMERNTRHVESAGQDILHAMQQMASDFQHAGSGIAASLTVLISMMTNLLSEVRSSRRPPPGPPPSSSHPPPPPPSSRPSSSSSYPRITEID